MTVIDLTTNQQRLVFPSTLSPQSSISCVAYCGPQRLSTQSGLPATRIHGSKADIQGMLSRRVRWTADMRRLLTLTLCLRKADVDQERLSDQEME